MIDSRFYDLMEYLHRNGNYRYYWNPVGGEDDTKVSYWINGESVPVPSIWKNDVYFSVHPSTTKKSTNERHKIDDVQLINCLFAEFDTDHETTKEQLLQQIESLNYKPSAIIDSGGGYHCYWLLDKTFELATDKDRTRSRQLQYAWVEYVGADEGAKDITRVLRVPGTYNTKYETPHMVSIAKLDVNLTYTIEDLESSVQTLLNTIKESEKRPIVTPSKVVVNMDDQELLNKGFSSSTGAEFRSLWDGRIGAFGGDHSRADAALCKHLAFWWQGDANAIDRMFRQSALYRDKWERDYYRNRTINHALKSVTMYYDPTEAKESPAVKAAEQLLAATDRKDPTAQASTFAFDELAEDLHTLYLEALAFDEGNAQCVLAKYGDIFIYTDAYGWSYYNGTHWCSDGAESKLKRCTVEVLTERRTIATQYGKEQIIKAAKPDSRVVNSCIALFQSMVHKTVDIFDKDIYLLNCANGTVDLRTGNIRPHNPGDYITLCLGVEYDPSADYAHWLEFLHQSVAHPDMVDYLQRAMGYSITGSIREECLFYVFGPTRSGKGTFTETILSILGKPLSSESDFSTFTAKRNGDTQNFDLAPLKPARTIISSESQEYDTLNEAKVKQITGGNFIRCAFKNKTHFEYKPQFTIWLVSNHPVKGNVLDDAFWGRLRVISFPNSNLGKEDKTLKARMMSPESLKGVLAWMVAGSVAWYNSNEGLEIPEQVAKDTNIQRDELDQIQQWIDEECKPEGDNKNLETNDTYTSGSELYLAYEGWCGRNGITPKKRRGFSMSLKSKNYLDGREYIDGKKYRVFYHIGISG